MKKLLVLALSLLPITILFGYFSLAFYLMHSDDVRNRQVIKERLDWVETNKEMFMFVFSDLFPKAENCKDYCEEEILNQINIHLKETLSYERYPESRLPVYFIKLQDKNTIGKLFQGGGYKEEPVDTAGENMVVEMLQGKRDPFDYPQYNCCGASDFVPEFPVFNLFLPIRTYLNDFPSEIEHVLLVTGGSGEIIGGIVYLYGD